MSQASIRAVLRAHPIGLTVPSIAARIKKNRDNTGRQILGMPDVYIASWIDGPLRSPVAYVPVYAVAKVPENAPRPD